METADGAACGLGDRLNHQSRLLYKRCWSSNACDVVVGVVLCCGGGCGVVLWWLLWCCVVVVVM